MRSFKPLMIGVIVVIFILALGLAIGIYQKVLPKEKPEEGEFFLPMPRLRGTMSLEEAIARRRSVRKYLDIPLELEEVSQLLWSAQGITDVKNNFRAAPSAGATYPLELYLLVREGGVDGLDPGIYKYDPYRHSLKLIRTGDFSKDLCSAALKQEWILEAPISIIITAIYERTTGRYGERGIRYVHMEVGHVGQNIYLQATALDLGTVVVGAFYDEEVRRIISAPDEEAPLYIIPVGKVERLHELTADELKEYYEENRG